MTATAAARVEALLAQAGARRLRFWWRDDDAVVDTPALRRLLDLSRRHGLPLALAVIPGRVQPDLAKSLHGEPHVTVLQHGWLHADHSGAGEKKAEYGPGRDPAAALDELRRGRERLQALFPDTFLPVLVPPWNRITPDLAAACRAAGLPGLSVFGPTARAAAANTHLDILAWRPVRRALDPAEALAKLEDEILARLQGRDEPIGLLTHHLVHDAAAWALLDRLLALLGRHPAAEWPAIPALFELTAETATA